MIAREPQNKGRKSDDLESTRQITKQPSESKTLLGPEWFSSKTNDELVTTIHEISLELKRRLQSLTQKQMVGAPPLTFNEDFSVDSQLYTQLPARSAKPRFGEDATLWRLALISSNSSHDALYLEIFDDVVIGRAAEEGQPPDLDLTTFKGAFLGVSRTHAIFRPLADKLLLVDLDSTNGTYCNGTRLKSGGQKLIDHDDVISLAGLHFKVKIIYRPGDQTS